MDPSPLLGGVADDEFYAGFVEEFGGVAEGFCPAFGVVGDGDDASDAGLDDDGGALRAGHEGPDVEGASVEVFAGGEDGVDLGVDDGAVFDFAVFEAVWGVVDAGGVAVEAEGDDELALGDDGADLCAGVLAPFGDEDGHFEKACVPILHVWGPPGGEKCAGDNGCIWWWGLGRDAEIRDQRTETSWDQLGSVGFGCS